MGVNHVIASILLRLISVHCRQLRCIETMTITLAIITKGGNFRRCEFGSSKKGGNYEQGDLGDNRICYVGWNGSR
jgi:hypothetical protein